MGHSTRHFLHCDCGAAIPFSVGECGLELRCPNCDASRQAPPLTRLKEVDTLDSGRSRQRGFSLGALLAFTAVWGLTCYGALAPRRAEEPPVVYDQPLDRSWESGSIEVDYRVDGALLRFVLRGSFPDATDNLNLKYSYWLSPKVGAPVFSAGGQIGLKQEVEHSSAGYDFGSQSHPELLGTPVRVLVDYEIWEGDVGSGTLLHKSSVYSAPLELPSGDEL